MVLFLSSLEKSQQHGESEESDEEELKKRNGKTPGPASKKGAESKRGTENEASREFEKIEKVEVKEKEHGTLAEEKAHELLEEEEDKRSPPTKKDGSHGKRDGKEARGDVASKRKDKKHFSDENEDNSPEELEHEGGYHGGNKGWYHINHEDWEERKRGSQRRMAEDPSQEETAQFQTEDRGMKYFNTHMHGYHGEEKRHIYHPEEDMDRERNHYNHEEEMEQERHHHNVRPENHEQREEEEELELEEMKEREEHRAEVRD